MPDQRLIVSVTAEEARQRLDRFLARRFPQHSRSRLQALIRSGLVTIQGRTPRSGQEVREGETIEVVIPPVEPSILEPEPIELSILYEDRDLIVVDKPAGLVVHPGAGVRRGTLVHGLLHHCRDLRGVGGVERPGIVHRLDKETSGVLVAAKNDETHRDLVRQFQQRSVSKLYLALVWGRIRADSGSIDVPLGRDSTHRTRISARTSRPRDARTAYRVLERPGEFSLVEVMPRTGRTHQIRVHMKHIGHPVAGDAVYGGADWRRLADPAQREALRAFRRLALHARRLGFTHPRTGERIDLQAPIPEALEALVEAMRGAP